ncbi:hypothetical protein [Streptomyces sp. 2A115]|uniref:hypothetical protein n=1 Tax=Streptomyces sp. 2A115 TaxID=3457439 RepID=UPI003FD25B9D
MSGDISLHIGALSPDHADDFGLMSTVTSLVNEVYEVAEKGLATTVHQRDVGVGGSWCGSPSNVARPPGLDVMQLGGRRHLRVLATDVR